MEEPTFYTGTVKFYNHKAKFGFIKQDDSDDEFYVRKSGLIDEVDEGDRVQFAIEPHDKGPKAVQVSKLSSE